jgi:hypothetical protein
MSGGFSRSAWRVLILAVFALFALSGCSLLWGPQQAPIVDATVMPVEPASAPVVAAEPDRSKPKRPGPSNRRSRRSRSSNRTRSNRRRRSLRRLLRRRPPAADRAAHARARRGACAARQRSAEARRQGGRPRGRSNRGRGRQAARDGRESAGLPRRRRPQGQFPVERVPLHADRENRADHAQRGGRAQSRGQVRRRHAIAADRHRLSSARTAPRSAA